MSPTNIRHRGPAQKRVLDGDVILLRKVNFRSMGDGIVDRIRNTRLRGKELEGDQPWFLDGYITGEQPRDGLVARAIMTSTEGFAIARTDSGEILAEFGKNEASRAEQVTHGARVELAVDVALRESEGEPQVEAIT